MSRERMPTGCAIPLFIALAIAFYFSTRDSPEEIQKQKDEHKASVSKYDYNPDTLASNLNYSYSESPDSKETLKGKVLVLYVYKNNISFNPKPTAQLPDDAVAFKRSDLQTIVLESHSQEMISKWGAHGVIREQAELKFIDYSKKKVVYSTIVLGIHPYESKGRKGNTTHYRLFESDVASEIMRIINKTEF